MTRRGLALILVVGVLGILAVLAAAFVTMAQLERRASMQRLNATKAGLLARSGIEDALARLSVGQDPELLENRYGGEDWQLDGDTGAGSLDHQNQVYNPGGFDVEACPVRHAMRPSFFRRDTQGDPDLVTVEGRLRGYGGALGGGHYALRVTGEDGIYVNGGDLTSGGEHVGTYDETLKRILGNLAEELLLPRAAGENLVLNRPAGGWTSLDQADPVLRPYLVLEAWVDRKVIRPNVDPGWVPSPTQMNFHTPAAWAEVIVGQRDAGVPANKLPDTGQPWSGMRAFNPHTNSYAPDFERDGQGRIVGRAPVSLAWARSRPAVLRALAKGLAGVWLDAERSESVVTDGDPPGVIGMREVGNLGRLFRVTLSAADAAAFALALGTHAGFQAWAAEYPDWDGTSRFDSWEEFERFVDLGLGALTGTLEVQAAKRDLIKAQFNPNTLLAKFNPAETRYRRLDKSDLQVYAMEFSLANPLLGVSAVGRRVGAEGRLLATRTLSARLAFRQVRLTAQSEFCAGGLGDPQVVGDETAFRRPGEAGFIAPSGGTGKTFGARLLGGGGLSLQTYPEPQWPAAGGPCPPPATYDGHLELATVEEDPAAVAGLGFLAGWDHGYDADPASAGDPTCSPDERMGPALGSLMGEGPVGAQAILNTLCPEGIHSEAFRVPGYKARDNIGNGLQGLVSYWFKPFYGPEFDWPNGRRYPDCQITLALIGADPRGITSPIYIQHANQVLRTGATSGDHGESKWGGLVESSYNWNHLPSDDNGRENAAHLHWNPAQPRTVWHAHRWHLATFQWNVRATNPAKYAAFVLDAVPCTDSQYPYYSSQLMGEAPADPDESRLSRDCYREDGSFGEPSFYLGARGYVMSDALFSGSDGTFDELRFSTPAVPTDMNQSLALASDRFAAGRYYKEDAALDPAKPEYLSPVLDLGAGAALLRLDWTLVRPRPFRAPAIAPDLKEPPNLAYYGTGADPLAGETADAAISLWDADTYTRRLLPTLLTRSGTPVRVPLPDGCLRFGVDLRPRLDDNAPAWSKQNTPLLESLYFDDITLTFAPPGGPALTAWREGD